MTVPLDATNDPGLRSWVESANTEDTDFPIQNLPYGVFRRRGTDEPQRIGVAIGDFIADLSRCDELGLLDDLSGALRSACRQPVLNALAAIGGAERGHLRQRLVRMLAANGSHADERVLVPTADAEMFLPVVIGDYTDFYASIHHARRVGRMFRPDNPLLPNYTHIPIAYPHGRSSSIVISGTPVRRPSGQVMGRDGRPAFRISDRLDYEAEIGFIIGRGNDLGQPVRLDAADDHVFGLCLLNDWSARDIQAWESQPLGPFLSKSFATSISPWIVTLEALAPFRCPTARPPGNPEPLPYLLSTANEDHGGIDVTVDVFLSSADMRREGITPFRVSRSCLRDTYWTIGQMVAHHTSNGCNLRTGDLIGSGTISGPVDGSEGCLLEKTRMGAAPITLPTGETRIFLADGDEVTMRARAVRPGYRAVGFGACTDLISGPRS